MRRGYTLVELLVLILIVLTLSVTGIFILTPLPNRARHNARRAACQSNLKNIGLAFQQYLQDYDDIYPPARTSGGGWADFGLQPYIKSAEKFDCPSDDTRMNVDSASTSFTTYFYNLRLAKIESSNLKIRANTIILGEGEAASGDYACRDFSHCVGSNANGGVGTVPEAAKLRHLDGANYLFCDGHVKWLKPHRIQQRKIGANLYGFPLR